MLLRKLHALVSAARFLCGVILVLSIAGAIFPQTAQSTSNLGIEQPYSVVFVAMMQRGVADFAAMNRRMPGSLDEVVDAGYTAYLPPSGLVLEYVYQGDTSTLSSNGNSVMSGNQAVMVLKDYVMSLPRPGLYTEKESPVWFDASGNYQPNPTTAIAKFYHFTGAEWLDKGYSQYQVVDGLRFLRLWKHLVFASTDYSLQHNGQELPRDLTDLEAYMGVARNPGGWQGVTVVDSPMQVDNTIGGIFVGWVDGKWMVRCNCGPEIKQTSYEQIEGRWLSSPAGPLHY